ncbi:MAG: hypothetical protein ABH872_00130 [Candidatus Omnitrophota bacterium]
MIAGDINQKIKDKALEVLSDSKIELFEFRIFVSNRRKVLRLLIDYPEGGITIDECAAVNRKLFSFLEESKLLGDDFTIEVNSPGLNRPLRTGKDFLRVKGRYIMLWLVEPLDGRGYLEGRLMEVNKDVLEIAYKGEAIKVDISKVKTAKEKIEV